MKDTRNGINIRERMGSNLVASLVN
jgi:hypothetical protein